MSYDDMCVYWGPTTVPGQYGSGATANGVIVTANSRANAALLVCGIDLDDNRLTHEIKQALGSSSSGGAFYTFAQLFTCMKGSSGYSYPSWQGFSPSAIMDTLSATLGPENVWYCTYTADELASAQEDLEVILNGGTIGGGSGSGSSTGGVAVDGDWVYFDTIDAPNNPDADRKYAGVALPAKWLEKANEFLNEHDGWKLWLAINDGTSEHSAYITATLVSEEPEFWTYMDVPAYKWVGTGNLGIGFVQGGPAYREYDGKEYCYFGYDSDSDFTAESRNGYTDACRPVYSYYYGDLNGNIEGDYPGTGSGSGSGSGGETEEPGPDLEWPDPVNVNVDIDFDTSDIVYVLSQILADMRNLDRSTNDLVDLTPVITAINGLQFPQTDLTGVTNYLSRILTSIGEVSGLDINGINGMLSYIHNDLGDTNDALADIETAIGNISIPNPPDLSGIRSDLTDIETAIGNISIPAAPNLTGIQTDVEDILDVLEHADYGTDMTQVEDLLETNNARLGSILTAINGLDIPTTDLTETVSAIDDVADACTDIYTDIHAYFAEMLGYWDGIDDTFVTFFTSWPDWVTDWSGKWSSLMTKLDQIYRRLGKKPWTGDVVGDPGVTLPDPGTDIMPIGDDDIGFPLPHFDWDELAPILHIPALKAAILELMAKFPFCMLNEIVTIGGYMLRQPMTPVFDLPAPNPSDWSHPHLVHIDLSDFDQCAAVLRTLIMMWAGVRISNKTIRMWMGDKEVY